ncbi:MAG TPA: hypothetical protein VN436_06065, partial [Holophaga sp.]|nr:hypothetical protein [Holophaga sp.]
MDQRVIESSIMFKHMLDQNRSLAGKTAASRPRVATLLELPTGQGAARLGLITLELADFHLTFAGIGMETGLRCLDICLDEAVTQFAAAFPGCSLLRIQEASPGDYVLLFAHASDHEDELFFLYLAYRDAVARTTAARMQLVTGEGREVLVGFACLESGEEAPSGVALFSAVCKARRLAQKRLDTALFRSKSELR